MMTKESARHTVEADEGGYARSVATLSPQPGGHSSSPDLQIPAQAKLERGTLKSILEG